MDRYRDQARGMMQPAQPMGEPGMGFLDYIKQHNPAFIETLRQISTQTQPGPFTSGRAAGRGLGSPPVGGGGGGFGQFMPGAPQGQGSPDLSNAMVQLAELLAQRGR